MALNKQKLEEKFAEVYKNLNKEQQIAVNTIEGPVMVIAGPGTGKTQILAARIGKILLETDTSPENIICLTYTDAGVVAMRKRLQQFIGADAYKVSIYTFHAFCNDVIQDNLSLFEKNSVQPISDIEKDELIKELIDGFQKNHPLRRLKGSVYYDAKNLKELFANIKKEGWTTDFLFEKIDEFAKSLDDNPDLFYKINSGNNKKGDKKPKYFEEINRIEKLKAAVGEFNTYQKLMAQKERYDFEDMITWVIKAFEENANLLAEYQERYQYILVDEFQDSNGSQNRIVQLLISYWDRPNVFVVGDDDQSIYRFQGANVQNMLNFAGNYSNDLTTIVLTKNYRSTQPILDISKSVINNNNERLVKQLPGLSKDLVAANTKINHLQTLPEIIEYNSVSEEMIGIVLKIESLIQEGVAPGKIAVIYRENNIGTNLADYFRLKEIPYYIKKNVDLLQQPFIKKIITILNYIVAEHDFPYGGDELLFEILHFDFYKIPPIEIAKLAVEVNKRNFSKEPSSLRLLLNEKSKTPAKTLFDEGFNEKLIATGKVLEQLIADASNITVQQVVDQVIKTAGVLSYIMNSSQKVELMQYLSSFFSFVKEENKRNPWMSLQELVNLIDLMKTTGNTIPLLQVTGNDKGVNLITAHSSKGLEFEHVFLAGCNAYVWEKKSVSNKGFKLPPTVFQKETEVESLEEQRRLFFVALTRAEKHLYISYANLKDDGKNIEPSIFVAEVQEDHPIEIIKPEISKEVMNEFQYLIFSNRKPVIETSEDDFIDALLSKFVMSMSALNSYLNCPLGFYFQNIIRIPAGKNENLVFGTSVHKALEVLFRMMKNQADVFPPVEALLTYFKNEMTRHRELFTKNSFQRRIEQGEKILPAYYNHYVNSWNKIILLEANYGPVTVNQVPIKGKIDKIEFRGNTANVVDYKTGSYQNATNKLKPSQEKNPLGGDYWRQAVFYKILLDNDPKFKQTVETVEFDFVEPQENKGFAKKRFHISTEEIEIVKQQISDTWHQIQNKNFYTGCGKSNCQWCNFVKDNSLYVRLEDEE